MDTECDGPSQPYTKQKPPAKRKTSPSTVIDRDVFSERLRNYMNDHGLTIDDAAKKILIPGNTQFRHYPAIVRSMLEGRPVKQDAIQAIADAFHIAIPTCQPNTPDTNIDTANVTAIFERQNNITP